MVGAYRCASRVLEAKRWSAIHHVFGTVFSVQPSLSFITCTLLQNVCPQSPIVPIVSGINLANWSTLLLEVTFQFRTFILLFVTAHNTFFFAQREEETTSWKQKSTEKSMNAQKWRCERNARRKINNMPQSLSEQTGYLRCFDARFWKTNWKRHSTQTSV